MVEYETCECKETASPNDTFVVKLMHKKCCVIKKTKSQMSQFNDKYGHCVSSCRSSSYTGKIWDRRNCIVVILVITILAWLCVIFGAVLGSAMCSGDNRTFYFKPMVKIPGLNSPSFSKSQLNLTKMKICTIHREGLKLFFSTSNCD